ncbi:lipopolysaccharide biosynthesis protein [Colwelliaceae bacterium BS250]
MSKKSLGNGAIYLVTNIINAAIPFLLLPILTRVLTPSDYGLITMFALVVTLLGAFAGLSIHGAVNIRFFKMSKQELSEYICGSLSILIASSSFIFLLILLCSDVFYKFTLLPKEWLLLACAVAGCQFLINIKLALWQVRKQAVRYGVFKILLSLGNALLSLYFIFMITENWGGRALGIAFSVFVFAIISLILLFKNKDLTLKLNKNHITDALKFGVPLIPHTLGAVAISMVDRFLIANVLGENAVGIYMVGLQMAMVLAIVADAFVKAYSPWLYQTLNAETPETKQLVVGISYLVFFCFLLSIIPAYIFLKLVFTFFIGEAFLEAIDYIAWFLIGYAFIGMYYTVAGFYFFTNKTGQLSVITFSTGVFSFIITYLAIKQWGLLGGAMSFALSNAFLFFLAMYNLNNVIKLPWLEVSKAFSSIKGKFYA